MKVSAILRRKGTGVETTRPHATVAEAAGRLTQERIGSLVVLDDAKNLVGVISERDIVRALAKHGPSAGKVSIAALMTGRPTTCAPDDSIEHVLSLMTDRKTRHVPVVTAGVLIGIVSIGDIVKSQLADLRLEVGVLRDRARAGW